MRSVMRTLLNEAGQVGLGYNHLPATRDSASEILYVGPTHHWYLLNSPSCNVSRNFSLSVIVMESGLKTFLFDQIFEFNYFIISKRYRMDGFAPNLVCGYIEVADVITCDNFGNRLMGAILWGSIITRSQ